MLYLIKLREESFIVATETQDTIWKEALVEYLPDFMALCFPIIYHDIDWHGNIAFLDKELQQLLPDDEQGKQITDLLVQLHRFNGEENYFLIHIEIQGYSQDNFAQRLFLYNVRLMLRHKEPVVSLVIYTDANEEFRPTYYEVRYWNFYHEFGFPIVKLLDFREHWDNLENDTNPFAALVIAQLKMHELQGRAKIEELAGWKLRVLRLLLERGLSREEIVRLFRFVNSIMRLPEEREEQFKQEALQLMEEATMPLLSPFEELAMRKGREEGLQLGEQKILKLLLETHFGALEPNLVQALTTLSDKQVEALVKAQASFTSKDDLTKWLQQPSV
jgi:hypothetical protein